MKYMMIPFLSPHEFSLGFYMGASVGKRLSYSLSGEHLQDLMVV